MSDPYVDKALAVIDAVGDGVDIHVALTENGISWSTFWRRKRDNPDLETRYSDALRGLTHLLTAEIVSIADTDENAARARNRIDARKLASSRWNPKEFGDRLDLNVTGTISVTAALAEARGRLERPLCDLEQLPDGSYGANPPLLSQSTTDSQSEAPTSSDVEAAESLRARLFDD